MRLSGMNFNVNLGDIMVHVDTATLSITDNSAVSQTGGVLDATTKCFNLHFIF